MTDKWQFDWLTSWDEIWAPSFISQWQGWMDQSPNAHVFFHPALVRPWVETYLPLRRIEPRFLVARLASECTVFFPLVLDRAGWKGAWLRSLRPVGFTEYDYHDPLACGRFSETGFEGFWKTFAAYTDKFLGKEFDEVLIPRVRADSAVRGHRFREANKAPFLDLAACASLEDVLNMGSKNLRREVRRRLRYLDELGPLTLSVYHEDEPESASAAVCPFLTHHEARWPDAFRANGFYERLIASALPSGVLRLSVLRSGERPVSWHIGFVHHHYYYAYLSSFNSDFAGYSPGKVHLALLIEDAIRSGIKVFDLLTGMEDYKLRWTRSARLLYTWQQHASGVVPAAKRRWHTTLRPRVAGAKRALVHGLRKIGLGRREWD